MTARTIRLAVAAFALSCSTAGAGPYGPGARRGPAFLRDLFPASLIMQHQSDIGLTAAQREAITKEMTDTQKSMLEVRWQLEERTAALTKLLAAPKVDESAALSKADEVVELENRLKRLRLALMIRVKNLLTPAQQETLRTLQDDGRGGGRPRPEDGDRDGLEP